MIRVQNSVTRRGRAGVTVLAGNKRPVSVCFRVPTEKKARPPANSPLLPTEEEHIKRRPFYRNRRKQRAV